MPGSSTILRRCSGCWARKAKKQVNESLTVSSPAMTKRNRMSRISSWLSLSPPTSAARKRLMMPSRGSLSLLDQVGEVAVDDPGAYVVHGTTRVRVDVGGGVEFGGMQDVVPHIEE